MRIPLTQLLDELARRLVPFALSVLLVLAAALPWPVSGYTDIAPSVSIMVIFYWTISRPDLMPNVAALAIGLIEDVIQGAPLGFNALVLLIACGLARSQQQHIAGRPFALHWAAFVIIATLTELMRWALLSAITGVFVGLGPVSLHLLMTVALYPGLAWLLVRCQGAFLRQA
jgi:rod shape-determining protein MreD